MIQSYSLLWEILLDELAVYELIFVEERAEHDEVDFACVPRRLEPHPHGPERDVGSLPVGVPVDARADAAERERPYVVLRREVQAAVVAVVQEHGVLPDRSYCVQDVFCGELEPGSYFCLTDKAPTELSTVIVQLFSSCVMNCSVNYLKKQEIKIKIKIIK